MIPQELMLPKLRSDIQLNEAPPEPEGGPAWTLYDPAANKYYKIGWLEFECLTRFEKCRTAKELILAMESETTLHPDEDEISALVNFLILHNLVFTSGEGAAKHFGDEKARREKEWWETILHGYLFFTIPLFKPQRFLEKTFPYVRPLFSKKFMIASAILFAYGVFLSLQRFDEFTTTFMNYFNIEGVILFLVATVVVKIFHELGHAYTATKYGVPVNVMGIAVMVMYPVLYSETTNAWKLQSRRHRVYIAASGVMTEFVLASVALILWHVLTPGIAQSLCFMIAVVSLLASLVVNLNPLMRFDGYYLFSDIVGVDNLQDRSFAFAKWKLRRYLWGWQDEPPEIIPPERQNFLTTFGFSMLVYRFLLYTGIAVLVYHLFFQPLGLILMMVELTFFIILPIWREMKVWWKRRDEIQSSRRARVWAVVAGIFVLLALIPVQTSIEVPAVMHAQAYKRLYASAPARIDEILIENGDRVEKGALLLKLSSPQLDYGIEVAQKRSQALIDIKNSGQANLDLARKRMTLDSEIDTTRKELEGLIEQRNLLQITAPYSGIIRDLKTSLHAGEWVSTDLMLGLLVDDSKPILSGYVREKDVTRVNAGNEGLFYVEYSPFQRFAVTLDHIEQGGSNDIFWPELSSIHNGPLPAERGEGGRVRSLPRYTLYAARFSINENTSDLVFPEFVARGTVRLKASRTSLLNILIQRAISVVIRESGF